MSHALNKSLLHIANLEKQLFLERESKTEFQKAVKREVVNMKKKAFITEKHLADSVTVMKAALSECSKITKALESPGLAKLASNRNLQEIKQGVAIMTRQFQDEIASMREGRESNPPLRHLSTAGSTAGSTAAETPQYERQSTTPMLEPMSPALSHSISDLVIEEEDDDTFDETGDAHISQGSGKHTHHSSAPATRSRACTLDWQNEGRSASSEQIEVLLKEVYVMMCGSSNNADPNGRDGQRDVSLETFMTLEEFQKFATLANLVDDKLTMPAISAQFDTTVRSSSRGAKKFSKRIQFDDFRIALAEMAEVKFPYQAGLPPLDTLLTDFVWPMRSRMMVKKELGEIMQVRRDESAARIVA